MSWLNVGTEIENSPLKSAGPLQSSASHNRRLAPILFGIFIFLYIAYIVYQPHFGLIDDIRIMFSSDVGKHLPFDVILSSGRFAPLEGQIYTIPGYFLPTPLCFFTINAIELVFAALLLISLGRLGLCEREHFWPYALATAVMVTPGFAECWLRLFVPEKEEFILLAVFFLFFLKIQKSNSRWLFLPCLLAATLALLSKETAFIIVGGIGFFHLFLNRKGSSNSRILDAVLVTLSGIWLAIYYFFVYRFHGPSLYSAKSGKPVDAILHMFASNALHDSWIILCLLFLLVMRIRQVKVLKQDLLPVLDSVLLSSFCFYLAYCVLRMANIYYLLPLYVFVPYIGCTIVSSTSLKSLFKPALIALLVVFSFTQMLSGMREVLTWKFAPANFQTVLKVISLQISLSHKKVNIYLGGSSRGSGTELYCNLADYLTYMGFHSNQFDIKSNTPLDKVAPHISTLRGSADCPYSFCTLGEDDQPFPGDYILLTPYDSIYKRSTYNDSSHYQLVFRTNTTTVPDLSVKTLAGHILPHILKDTNSGMIDTNFYLYKVL
jgi:hypothetical protein